MNHVFRFDMFIHYPILREWLAHYKWPDMHVDMLPEYGIIVGNGEQYLCVGFLYKTDSNIALLEWVVGNPHVSHEIRADGIRQAVDDLLKEAKECGYRFVFSYSKSNRLLEKYEQLGFIRTDENVTHGVWRL